MFCRALYNHSRFLTYSPSFISFCIYNILSGDICIRRIFTLRILFDVTELCRGIVDHPALLFAFRFTLSCQTHTYNNLVSHTTGVDINKCYAQTRYAVYNYAFTTLFKHNIPCHCTTTRLIKLILINRT